MRRTCANLTWTVRFFRGFIFGALGVLTLGFAACSSEAPPPVSDPAMTEVKPASAFMRRLLARQYVNTVEMMLGKKAAQAAQPPDDTALNGYQAIAASQLALNDELVAVYETSALAVAAAAVDSDARAIELAGCDPADEDERTCFERYVAHMGRLAFRRPLIDEEIDDYAAVAETALEEMGRFRAGIEFATAALLQSPSFLFQIELGTTMEGTNARKLTGYEMASAHVDVPARSRP